MIKMLHVNEVTSYVVCYCLPSLRRRLILGGVFFWRAPIPRCRPKTGLWILDQQPSYVGAVALRNSRDQCRRLCINIGAPQLQVMGEQFFAIGHASKFDPVSAQKFDHDTRRFTVYLYFPQRGSFLRVVRSVVVSWSRLRAIKSTAPKSSGPRVCSTSC